jgi:uncharacterized protein YndB with AHSA1/START domain
MLAVPLLMASSVVHFESTTTVHRPVDVVFDRLADLRAYDSWMHRTGLFRRCRVTSGDGPVRLGTGYDDSTRMGTFRGEVTEFEPPSRLAFLETLHMFGSPAMQARVAYTFEAGEEGTVVHHTATGELFGPMRLMKPMAALMAKSERTRTLRSLESSLDS